MARSISQIYDELWLELQTQSELNALDPQTDDQQTLLSDLSSTSRVAEHRLWLWLFAVYTWLGEVIYDRHVDEVEAIVAASPYGHVRWWQSKMLEFQYGSSLAFVDNRPGYVVEDVAQQIVKRAAAVSLGGGNVLLKAAKLSGSDPVALSVPELTALTNYCRQIQPAGPTVQVISLNADKLKLTDVEVIYDPLVIAPDGSLISDGSTFPVEDAINAYLAAIPFNGVFETNAMVDAVQAVEGVIDFRVNQIQQQVGVVPYADIVWQYPTVAGYMREDTSAGNTFADDIVYTAG